MSRSILILCPDVITERMAGPAIRYWEFAKALRSYHNVTLAAPNPIPDTVQAVAPTRLLQHTPENITELVNQHDIIIFQGYIFDRYPILRHTHKILVADMYDPIPLEGLERHKNDPWQESTPHITHQVRIINDQLKLADYFLCASDRQRHLWLGHLLALGRINPLSYNDMQQRVMTIPFGLPDAVPQRTGLGFRQHFATQSNQSNQSNFVLLWGGGIWEWFDPLTLIRVVHRLLPRYPELRLVFLGTQHPNPTIPIMPMQQQAEALARDLGIYGTAVLFQAGWVPYEVLQNHLLDADVGVTAHFNTLETHFSFRTRILYYLWAGKPIITTQGDTLAEEIAQYQAGITVGYQDEAGWIAAIEQLRDPTVYAKYCVGVQNLARRYLWSQVTQPLSQACTQATVAADMLIESGTRRSTVWDCEQEYHALKQHLHTLENSNSWRITAPLRAMRRWLGRK